MSECVAGVEAPNFEANCRLAAELHVMADTLKLLTAEVERVFRVVSDEARRRAQLEADIDDAVAAVERAEKHRGGADAEGFADMARRRREAHAQARERLAAFNADSWAARIQRLEEAKSRARANLHVPITGTFQGPLMQRVLQQGTTCAPADIMRLRQAAMANFADITSDLARTATPHDGATPAVELHAKWSAAALLTQPNSQIAADIAQAAQSLQEIGFVSSDTTDGGVTTFQDTFARAQASSVVPRMVRRPLPLSAYPEEMVGAPIAAGDLLPPAKHVLTCRLSARSSAALAEMFSAEMDVVRRRLREVMLGSDGGAMPPQSLLTNGRMLRRPARRPLDSGESQRR